MRFVWAILAVVIVSRLAAAQNADSAGVSEIRPGFGASGPFEAVQPAANPRPMGNRGAFMFLAQAAPDLATLLREGRPLYAKNCAVCHGAEGQGGGGPRLVGNPAVSSTAGLIGQIFQGDTNQVMPAFGKLLNDRQIAAIATYVRNSWGNDFGVVPPEYVSGAH